ncbi:hypothetical protein F7725_004217 [Dissostichus mawsoni]|uniref:Evolutionarily conserved signaling intermediate in Toll pathway, mitochondrial n=1 Tax=Dissostichus mawsoni TaxID=36200 RepID=A0A7J5XIS7_DISMA|nr:hypothetical protein F7725_004217 [Dissostichus mawsoni]
MKCARCLLQLQGLRLQGLQLQGLQLQEFIDEDDNKKDKSLVIHDDLFEQVARETKTKATFNKVVEVFIKQDVRRRGHVEFIYAALQKMPEFGVERDLAVYNKLLDVFPKEIMFNHYPRQQECGVQLLEQMEGYGSPVRKYQRILYWFPKFKHTNPYPIPKNLPEDPVDLARFSLARIADDRDAKVTVYQLPCTDITESGEEITLPHVVGIQSPSQMELLAQHNPSRPVFVEGPFPLWLRNKCVYYYVLRADPVPPEEKVEEPYDPERSLAYPLQLDLDLDRDLGDEESFDVEDWEVFAMCMTNQGDQAVLNQWVSGLQQYNPILGRVPTLFRLEQGPANCRGPINKVRPPAQAGPPDPERKKKRSGGRAEEKPGDEAVSRLTEDS